MHKIKHVHQNLEWPDVQSQTYYLCIFAALSELLHGISMFNVVHRDGIDHHHTIILSKTIQTNIIQSKHWLNELNLCIPIKHNLNESRSLSWVLDIIIITQNTARVENVLQQSLCWTSFQHIRYHDGRLPALKMRVVSSTRDGNAKPKTRCLDR